MKPDRREPSFQRFAIGRGRSGKIETASPINRFATQASLGTWIIYLATLLLLALIIDPSDTGYGLPLTFQFLPAALALSGVAAYVIAGFHPVGRLRGEDLAFGIVIVMTSYGGFATVWDTGEPADSFFRVGLAALSYIPYRMMAAQPDQLDWFFRRLRLPVLLIAAAMALQLFYWELIGPFIPRPNGINHIFHEEVFILSAATVLAAVTLTKRPALRISLVALFVLGQIFTFKNTGFLTALLTVFYLAVIPAAWLGLRENVWSIIRTLGLIYFTLLIVVFLLLLPFFQDSLPDGSLHVRLYTYGLRWDQFLEQPLFGKMFYGSPLIEVPGTNLVIPSHSDLMDILAFGGIVGTLSFMTGAMSLFFFLGQIRQLKAQRDIAIVMHILTFSLAIVTVFNVVLLQPKMAGFLWMGLAVLTGLKSRAFRTQAQPDLVPSQPRTSL